MSRSDPKRQEHPKTAGHTPGPLEVRIGPHPESGRTAAEWQASLLRGGGSVFVIVAPDPERPAPDYLVTAVTGDGPAARANACLYAAAPDLLAALRAFTSEATRYHTDCGHGLEGSAAECDSVCECIAAAEAAIAKAEGRA